jgi:subtilisin family serine protease
MRNFTLLTLAAVFLLVPPPPAGGSILGGALAGDALVDPQLVTYLGAPLLGRTAPAVVTYRRMPGPRELDRLRSLGVDRGFVLRSLPMVIADLGAAQVAALAGEPGVASVWGNEVMQPLTNESRGFIGVPQLMADGAVTVANGGLPVSGRGVGVGYIDTGIDATRDDLAFGTKVVQNVNQPLAYGVVSDGGLLLGVGISISDLLAGTGFVPPIYLEDQLTTDLESGHGTHGAGVTAGSGMSSGGFYGGVAPGAHLVGVNVGDDMGLPLVAILGGFDYLLTHREEYAIRVINNSWGSSLSEARLSPDNPINVATRLAHDAGVVVVFAAGNAGSAAGAINPYSTMAWTISVAAGVKNGLGSPAGFSSRGEDDGTGADVAGIPADPLAPPNLRPDVTAPGVAVIANRATAPGPFMNANSVLNGDANAVPPAFLPFYYSANGTSFAAPHVSGVVALLLEADPSLTPGDVVTLLRATANPMPFPERVVGAGYVDAHNAVRAALGLAAVAPPADLLPGPDTPEILDARSDQLGTSAQDILAADFAYDEGTDEIVYRMTVADMASATPNNRWTMSSIFGETTVFVSASIDETLAQSYRYGRIVVGEGGIRNQETIGEADGGAMEGDEVTIRLARAKVDAAVGFDTLGTVSTSTAAQTQILIGTSLSGGLLLNSDSASGSDFTVAAGDDGGSDPLEPCDGGTVERLAGALAAGEGSAEVAFTLRCSSVDARLTFHPGNQGVGFALVGQAGQVLVWAEDGRRLTAADLEPGHYSYRVTGPVARPVDFVVRSAQK